MKAEVKCCFALSPRAVLLYAALRRECDLTLGFADRTTLCTSQVVRKLLNDYYILSCVSREGGRVTWRLRYIAPLPHCYDYNGCLYCRQARLKSDDVTGGCGGHVTSSSQHFR